MKFQLEKDASRSGRRWVAKKNIQTAASLKIIYRLVTVLEMVLNVVRRSINFKSLTRKMTRCNESTQARGSKLALGHKTKVKYSCGIVLERQHVSCSTRLFA